MASLEEEADAIRAASISAAVTAYDRICQAVDALSVEFAGAATRRGIAQPWLIRTPYPLVVSASGSWAWTYTRDSDYAGRLSVTVPVGQVRAQLLRGVWGRAGKWSAEAGEWGAVADWFWHTAVRLPVVTGAAAPLPDRAAKRDELRPDRWRDAFVAVLVNSS